MYEYIIKGGNRLHGETYISGSKNASLPILAATLISGKTTKLYNVPDIEDVKITLEIFYNNNFINSQNIPPPPKAVYCI
jgi:UDP-N-acetylglucosamine 1-carboxyvinyltransferase